MSWNRPLLILSFLLAGAAFLICTVLPVDASRSEWQPEGVDSRASLVWLDQASQRLQPDQVAWLETDVWQRVQINQVTCTAQGRYLQAPGGRRRLELQTRAGTREGDLLVVCDGARLWEGIRPGRDHWSQVRTVRLRDVGEPSQVLLELSRLPLARSWFSGDPAALLQHLRTQVVWSAPSTVQRQGRALVKLRGRAPQGHGFVAGACECRLYLDLQTLWPHRLEWWDETSRRCLVELELRQPRFNQPRSDVDNATLFRFDPGNGRVLDQTPLVRDWLGLPPLES